MKWGLVAKGDIPHVVAAATKIHAEMVGLGEDVLLQDGLADAMNLDGLAMKDLDKQVDQYMTIGGDGTILYCQHHTEKPVLGINAGAIGFMAEVEPEGAIEAVQTVLAGKHRIEERQRLASAIDGEPLPDAINEVSLLTRRIAKLIRFNVDVDGERLETYRGDGIIVSTATGSTGYAMSVGGPLLHPDVEGTVIAPIAPFKLSARPWVVPSSSTIEVKLLERDSAQGLQQARGVIDGLHSFDVDTGATISISSSERRARFIRLGLGHYDRVRTKLER